MKVMNDFSFDEVPFRRGMGTISAAGASKTLNGSTLSDTEILLRESVQNSYDSRLEERIFDNVQNRYISRKLPLHFSLRAFYFSQEQIEFVQKVFNFDDETSYYTRNVKKYIKAEALNIEISDTNTSGLTGFPGITDKKGNQNFANFVYFTGNDKAYDSIEGGSFGFGKAAFFLYSAARTIIIYTRVKTSKTRKEDDSPIYESRLIAVSMDERIDNRCWWGKKKKDDNGGGEYAAPLLDNEAREIARLIGFSDFEKKATGTKILILNASPRLAPCYENGNPKSIDRIFRFDIPHYLVHWYWNKIYEREIIFDLTYKGQKIEIDDPSGVYPYKYFIHALKRLEEIKAHQKEADGKNSVEIEHKQPAVKLGIACIEKTYACRAKYEELIPTLQTSQPLIAFMRGIGNIVYYGKYPTGNDNLQETCYGIFSCDTVSASRGETSGEIDRYFRAIENQTHTRWEHNSVYPHNYLKTVKDKIENLVRQNCIFEEFDDSAANISIMIQRKLGEKLLPYKATIGGAKKALKDSSQSEVRANNKKSSITRTSKYRIEIDPKTNEKIIFLQYRVNVLEGKKIVIHNIIPKIETLDNGDSLFDTEGMYLTFYGTEKTDKSGMTYMTKGIPKEFTKPDVYYFKIKCIRNCSFDLKIEWEEVNND